MNNGPFGQEEGKEIWELEHQNGNPFAGKYIELISGRSIRDVRKFTNGLPPIAVEAY